MAFRRAADRLAVTPSSQLQSSRIWKINSEVRQAADCWVLAGQQANATSGNVKICVDGAASLHTCHSNNVWAELPEAWQAQQDALTRSGGGVCHLACWWVHWLLIKAAYI